MGCAQSSTANGGGGQTESMRDGSWYKKHVQEQSSSGAPMFFDRIASQDWKIVKKIGSGMQGSVYLAKNKENEEEEVAVKETHIGTMNSSGDRRREAYAELEALSRMRHPNIVRLISAYQTSSELQLVMEKIEGKSLISYLVECDLKLERKLQTEKEQREEKFQIMRQLCDAVAHVHARNVCFRDLQPDNVMITNKEPRQVKLIDFGRAVVLKREAMMESNLQPMGTSLFQAPEVEKRAQYGQASDMWAVGVFLYLLISNKMPFSRTVEGVYAVLRAAYEPFDDTFNKQARDLISKILVVNPAVRMNAAQVNQHKYLRKFDKDLKEKYQKSITNVSRERDILVQSEFQKDVIERSLKSLEEKKDIIDQCCTILCDLTPQDVATLRRWLNMSSEKSVHEGKFGIASSKQQQQQQRRAEEDDKEGKNINNSDNNSDNNSHKSSDFSWNDDSTHRGGVGLAHLGNSFRKSLDEDGEERSFIGLAHEQGLCSLDELITACVASSFFTTADQLVEIEAKVLSKRNKVVAGDVSQITHSKNAQEAIRNTVLIRHSDLLRLVETTQLERMKEESFHGGMNHFNHDDNNHRSSPPEAKTKKKTNSSQDNMVRNASHNSLEGSLRGGNSFKPRGHMPSVVLNKKLEDVRGKSEEAAAMVRTASSGSLLQDVSRDC